MSAPPTPGQICYAAYQAMLPERAYFPAAGWEVLDAAYHRAWEAAAQAVLKETAHHSRAVVNHWHEFGPEYGFEEQVHALETWLKAREKDTP
jgi:hypothetical protein